WSGDSSVLVNAYGARSALVRALELSPRPSAKQLVGAGREPGAPAVATGTLTSDRIQVGASTVSEEDHFLEAVVRLPDDKGKAYGGSWKKRGEQLSILPNIARKIDRLGVAGAGDTAADTAVDLMVYLAKYYQWLTGGNDEDIRTPLTEHRP